jgi:hypothetical protein
MKFESLLVPVAALSAVLLGGCASVGRPTLGQSTLHHSQPQQLYYFRGLKTVDRDYIDRYACADGRLLVCQCTSTHARTCDCSC